MPPAGFVGQTAHLLGLAEGHHFDRHSVTYLNYRRDQLGWKGKEVGSERLVGCGMNVFTRDCFLG